jgi:hypothetical protein
MDDDGAPPRLPYGALSPRPSVVTTSPQAWQPRLETQSIFLSIVTTVPD